MASIPSLEPQRADAQRNRARILEVAYDAFTTDPDVSMNVIAKRAEVGPGTLYRHFPTRDALLLSVYAAEIDSLGQAVQRSLETQAPLDAFRAWARRLAAMVRVKHGLGEAIAAPAAKAMHDSSHGPVITAIRTLLDAAAAAGEARPGLDPDDVLLLLSALWRVPRGDEGLRQADRILELVVDALRPEGPR